MASFQAVLSAGDYDKASKFFSQATDSEEGKLLEQFNKKCFKETGIAIFKSSRYFKRFGVF